MEKSDEEQDIYTGFFSFFSFKFIKDLPTKYMLNTEGKRVTFFFFLKNMERFTNLRVILA